MAPGAPHWLRFDKLQCTAAGPVRYEHKLKDGTVEVYTVADGAAAGARRIFLTQIIDPQGQSVQLTWDSQRRLVAVTDALGQVSTLQYDLVSDPLKITGITDPFGRQAVLTYNGAGQLESITDVIGMTSRFAYGGDDFINTLTTPYGTTSFRHEASALNSMFNTRFIEATDPLGGTEHMEFQFHTPSMSPTDSASFVPTGAGPNADLDHFNTFYWDKRAWKAGAGDLSKATLWHWLGHEEFDGWQEYSATAHSMKRPLENRVWYRQKRLIQVVGDEWLEDVVSRVLDDGTTQEWYSRFDASATLKYRRDPLLRQISYTYDTNNIDVLMIKQTNAAGTFNDTLSTLGSYVNHRPQSSVDAAGQTTTFTYNSAGQLLTSTNALSETTTYGYDTSGYLTSIAGAVTGSTTSIGYDGYGRVRTATGSDGYAVTVDYDLLDRPIRTTYPDSTFAEITYDRLGVASQRDRLGRVTMFYQDPLGRVIATRDPLGRTTTQSWCTCGSLDAIVDANGNKTRWTRDVQGRVTSETRANNSTVTYEYEATTSRLKKRTDALGQAANYEYFLDGKLKQTVYANATVTTPTVSMTYDATYGRLSTMTDGIGTTTYSSKRWAVLGRWASPVSMVLSRTTRFHTRTTNSAASQRGRSVVPRHPGSTTPSVASRA